jgi:hypothetical protein
VSIRGRSSTRKNNIQLSKIGSELTLRALRRQSSEAELLSKAAAESAFSRFMRLFIAKPDPSTHIDNRMRIRKYNEDGKIQKLIIRLLHLAPSSDITQRQDGTDFAPLPTTTPIPSFPNANAIRNRKGKAPPGVQKSLARRAGALRLHWSNRPLDYGRLICTRDGL